MDNHTHPEYERSLERVASVLETLVEAQSSTDAVVGALVAGQLKLVESQVELNGQMQAMAASQERFQDRLTASLDRLAVAQAGTEDKLNGLIDYFRRHLDEHRERG